MGVVTVAEDIISGQGTPWGAPADLEIPPGLNPANGAPQFLVQPRPGEDGEVDVNSVGIALLRAVSRLERVTYEGVEVAEEQVDDFYSEIPEGAAGPVVIDGGLYIDAYTQGEIPVPMLETMVAIIVDELQRAEASAHVSVGPDGVNAWERPVWAATPSVEP